MQKLNHNGFAISTILYGLLIVLILITTLIMSTMAFTRKNGKEFTENISREFEKEKKLTSPGKYCLKKPSIEDDDNHIELQKNPNILKALEYNQESCKNGTESTCKEVERDQETYPTSTIIKYQVNNSKSEYFYVLYSDQDTLTMQHIKNTIHNISWNQGNGISQGPITALEEIEEATRSWSNVKDQEYIVGATTFKDNPYTSCSKNSLICFNNSYMMAQRASKARMITVQELTSLGCNASNNCPSWLMNGIKPIDHRKTCIEDLNIEKEITENGKVNCYNGYWTMQTSLEENPFFVTVENENYNGTIIDQLETKLDKSNKTGITLYNKLNIGVRAVIVIDQYQ